MKKVLLILPLFIFAAVASFAQEDDKPTYQMRTLLGPDTEHGFFLAGSMMGSKFNGNDGLLAGGKLGWVIDHWFTFGLAGYGLTNPIYIEDINNQSVNRNIGLGYGGLYFEPRLFSSQAIHVAFPVIAGSGGASFSTTSQYYFDEASGDWVEYENESDAFFFIEPGIEMEINISKHFRIGVAGTYRYIDGLNLSNMDGNALNGFSGGINLKVGVF